MKLATTAGLLGWYEAPPGRLRPAVPPPTDEDQEPAREHAELRRIVAEHIVAARHNPLLGIDDLAWEIGQAGIDITNELGEAEIAEARR